MYLVLLRPAGYRDALEALASRATAVEVVPSQLAAMLPPPVPCAFIFGPLGLAMLTIVR